MGEVYRARDTRLSRDVAIKVLAPHLASDAAALARFEREAQAVAALSHPNIVALHDVGRHQDTAYAVMELLDGVTLRAALADGALPVRKALQYAAHIASGLAAAHDRGIVHRDLKPENIFITADGRAKILDFGLAHVAPQALHPNEQTMLPTGGVSTSPGMVLGTVGYMAPEQIRGQALDARTDIFAFGAVLYEILSGRRAFAGETPADTISAILKVDPPDITSIDASLPPALDRIVRRCLEKQPSERFHSARDLAFALEAVGTGSAGSAASSVATASATIAAGAGDARPSALARLWPVVAASAVALAAGVLAGRSTGSITASRPTERVVRFVVPSLVGFPPGVAVSPDGRSIAWTALPSASAEAGTRGSVFIRQLDSDDVRALPDSVGASFPFWSPDGRRVAYVRDAKLVLADILNSTQSIDLPEGGAASFRGADWHAEGGILVAANQRIWRLDPDRPTGYTKVSEPATGESAHQFPRWLPDGKRFVFLAFHADGSRDVRVGSVSGGPSTVIPVPGQVTAVLVDPAGYLIYSQSGSLIAHPFDVRRAALAGAPITISPDVDWAPNGWLAADVSRNGVIAFRLIGATKVQFEWVDRVGRRLGSVAGPESYTNFDLSPDGQRIAVVRRTADLNSTSIALIDMSRGQVGQAVETASVGHSDPTFSPDGTRLAYRLGRQVVTSPVNGGETKVLANWLGYPDSWSRDGRYLAVGRPEGRNYELWAIPLDGGEEIPLVQGVALADEPRFSPDGKWVVYHAAGQDKPQVFAIPFPPTGERWQISSDGGVQPRWRADGRELYFLSPTGEMMAVAVPDGGPPKAGKPTVLFNTGLTGSAAFDQFAPAPDGERFLIRRPLGGQASDTAPVTVIVNWHKLPGVTAPR